MTFTKSIVTCFSKYATFKGRASRSEFWWFQLFLWLLALIIVVAFKFAEEFFELDNKQANSIFKFVETTYVLTLIMPALAIFVRRLHDMNRSGWWVLLHAIAYVTPFAALILYVWCTLKSRKTDNKYDEVLSKDLPAAEQGYVEAQYNLGNIYRKGVGIPKDNAKAIKWFRLAAKQGHASAQSNLGLIYYKGDGVTENSVLAYKWWTLAAEQGDEDATKNKAIIKKEMTDEQIAEGQKLASEFVAVKDEWK